MNIWYSINVEKPIREIVFALRNHGINTTRSNDKTGCVEFECYPDEKSKLELWIGVAMISIGISVDKYSIEFLEKGGKIQFNDSRVV